MASVAPSPAPGIVSRRLTLAGHVQGVGFRPFVYRMAMAHGITGQVQNRLGEVEIVASGNRDAMSSFVRDLVSRAPPLSDPVIVADEALPPAPFDAFGIAPSSAGDADARIFVPPDYFMCDDCRAELAEPSDRRYRYPFINCTQCGPRYTLIAEMPYDRPNTAMAGFPLCERCLAEYEDPGDRRFHAEPVACPDCGPRLSWSADGDAGGIEGEAALGMALAALREGRVVAVKGVGGYHLLCDAGNVAAVQRLRDRKQRPDKPLAVMFPIAGEDGLDAVRASAELSEREAERLSGPSRPIVLLKKSGDTGLAENLAPGLADLGAFLPYSPLHQLLLDGFGGPLVATSGNVSGEPVLTDNAEAARRLGRIADGFLHHDRPILRPADDPVFRELNGRMRPVRAGRGTAPKEMSLPWRLERPVLAVGAHMKGTVALGWDDRVVVSPHIGEMDSPRSMSVFETVVRDLQDLYQVRAARIVCDAHPGYATHRWAKAQRRLPVELAWHHFAHASALAAEHGGGRDWLVFAWDGVGLGPDGTLWGGEALAGMPGRWRRAASLRPFRLPGGERAGREPWRSAAALSWEAGGTAAIDEDPDGLLRAAWDKSINAPATSAAGRLFDAAAALVTGIGTSSYEAQGPMELEALCSGEGEVIACPLREDDGVIRADWAPLLPMLEDGSRSRESRAASFHSSMAGIVLAQALRVRESVPVARIGLTGGVFQKRVLTEQVAGLLDRNGFDVALAETLPCNDAAIAFGQLAEVAAGDSDGDG